ncbi:MAG: hypothetical protein LBD32_02185 [Cytophagales bacterium]|jgi:hypothetical protein|nr:hypothetical protein [Cytophagales bacterium]
MFGRKFFTLLSFAIFLQCENPPQSSEEDGTTLNQEVNIFSDLISELKIELWRLKIEPTIEKRRKDVKELEGKIKKKMIEELQRRIDISLGKNLIRHMSFKSVRENEEVKGIMSQIKATQISSKEKIEELKKDLVQVCGEQYEKLILASDLPIFKAEVQNISEQFFSALYFMEDAIKDFDVYL